MADFLYIDQDEQLSGFCRTQTNSGWLAVDTEFLREKTYYPKLCLIQVASAHGIACIDPLKVADLSPLVELLTDTHIVKVVHAARQDIEVLYGRFDAMPRPLFDTQLAASLVGYGEQIGYAALVEQIADVHLAKAHTRTDWSRRPIPAAALAYAADDVRYLGMLYAHLRQTLQRDERLEWLQIEAAALTDRALYLPDPETSFTRVRGQSRLEDAAARGALRALAAWRERRAIDRNRPRQWILPDATLLDVARESPRSLPELERIEGTGGLLKAGLGEQVLTAVAAGRDAPMTMAATQRPSPEERRTVSRLLEVLRRRAGELGISATLLANRRQLERLARGERDVPVLCGWRREVVGDELLEEIKTSDIA